MYIIICTLPWFYYFFFGTVTLFCTPPIHDMQRPVTAEWMTFFLSIIKPPMLLIYLEDGLQLHPASQMTWTK